ncbi:ubiquitin-protein ligase peroxin 12 [Rhizoclosmatium sp. JEL0117]|nr:ubiquitin-protein ligase peroxin 12 [Rhizoclosmatium sp. JEL0117]
MSTPTISNRPTLFEATAASQLQGLIKPAVRYVLAWYGQQGFIGSLVVARLQQVFDELYLVCALVVEAAHVFSASPSGAAERFYGLRRRSSTVVQKAAALVALVLVPFVRDKAADAASAAREVEPERRTRTQKCLAAAWPVADFAAQAVSLATKVVFMFNVVDAYNPIDLLFNMPVVRMQHEDYKALQDQLNMQSLPASASTSPLYRSASIASSLLRRSLAFSTSYLVPASIFLFRFSEWWYQNQFDSLARTQEPIPPPPPSIEPHPDGTPLPEDASFCPLCVSELKNPSMLSSGYVFCYPCIYRYVERHRECPVTKIPVFGGGACVRKLYSMG